MGIKCCILRYPATTASCKEDLAYKEDLDDFHWRFDQPTSVFQSSKIFLSSSSEYSSGEGG